MKTKKKKLLVCLLLSCVLALNSMTVFASDTNIQDQSPKNVETGLSFDVPANLTVQIPASTKLNKQEDGTFKGSNEILVWGNMIEGKKLNLTLPNYALNVNTPSGGLGNARVSWDDVDGVTTSFLSSDLTGSTAVSAKKKKFNITYSGALTAAGTYSGTFNIQLQVVTVS